MLTAESIIGTAILKAAWALSLSPVLTATMTFLMKVRRLLRCPALRTRLFSACFARFLACAVLAIVRRFYKVSYQTEYYHYKCYHCQHLQGKTGNSMNDEDIRVLLEIVRSRKHAEFVENYLVLSKFDQLDSDLMMAYADSLYELGQDVEAIDAYLRFAQSYPKGRGLDFALFGAAMAFKNIGLEVEALYLLKLIKPDHVNLNNEIIDSKKKIDIQNQGIELLKRFNDRTALTLLLHDGI